MIFHTFQCFFLDTRLLDRAQLLLYNMKICHFLGKETCDSTVGPFGRWLVIFPPQRNHRFMYWSEGYEMKLTHLHYVAKKSSDGKVISTCWFNNVQEIVGTTEIWWSNGSRNGRAHGQSDRSKYVTDADGLKGLDVAKTDFVLGQDVFSIISTYFVAEYF